MGDAIKEAFLFYANHMGLTVKGTTNGVIPYYYKDSFFEWIFEKIKRAEDKGIGTSYNNQDEEWVRVDIIKIMEIRNEYKEKNDLLEIRDKNEQWKTIVDYIKRIYDEFQKFKEEAEKNNNKEAKT